MNRIAVIGAGAWGTALAQVLAGAGRIVTLYARDAALARELAATRRNATYLPDVDLDGGIRFTAALPEAAAGANIVLLATPAQHVRAALAALRPLLNKEALLVNCAKGIEMKSGRLLSEVAAEIAPGLPYAVLSGPTFAAEAARGLPTAVTLATLTPLKQAQAWAEALSSRTFRPYLSPDPVGAEIAGAVKNVIAIACGIVAGRGLGQNARAAVMTRGMAEIKRLGLRRGALPETFLGLSGIGDLTLTCHSLSSRNYSLGHELGGGKTLEEILRARRAVTEGVATAHAVAQMAQNLGVDMPICAAVDRILHRAAGIDEVIAELLARHLKFESE